MKKMRKLVTERMIAIGQAPAGATPEGMGPIQAALCDAIEDRLADHNARLTAICACLPYAGIVGSFDERLARAV